MNKFVACIAVVIAMLAAVSVASYSKDNNSWSFERFLMQYERDYSNVFANSHDAFEMELRRQIFYTNMQTIRAHNERYEQGLETWFMRPNQFADLTQAEFETKHLGLAKGSQRDSRVARRLSSVTKPNLKLTSKFEVIDWAKAGVMPKVTSQASCGSCWANAAANALGGLINMKYGYAESNFPSRQQPTACVTNPLECGGTGGCQGATAQLAFEDYAEHGVITEADYPYTSGGGNPGPCKEGSYTPKFSISGHKDITPNDKEALFQALKQGPVSVSGAASAWGFYGGGIYTKCQSLEVNHAIVLTGMGEQNGAYFGTIMNSWGAGWGEGGYMRLHMAAPDQEEVCGEDPSPYDGSACKKSDEPPRTRACGCNGLLYDSVVPIGIQKI